MLSFFARGMRRMLRVTGIDVVPFTNTNPDFVIDLAIRRHSITTLLDVGANRGQFAQRAIDYGFRGTIHSFEPMPQVFDRLARRVARHANWHAHRIALSDSTGMATLTIGANDQTSSLRVPLVESARTIAAMTVVGQVEVPTQRLDDFIADAAIVAAQCFLKLDVQGAEMAVLRGAAAIFSVVPLIQLETSLVPAYDQESKLEEMIHVIHAAGMVVRNIRPVYTNENTGELMQVDLIAERWRAS